MSLTRDELFAYWRDPPPEQNGPHLYAEREAEARSVWLVEQVQKFAATDARIFEPGCGIGRNLAYLYRAGYHRLHGLEISRQATEFGHNLYPELQNIIVLGIPAEQCEWVCRRPWFDLVYTMAFLEHLHPDSEEVFGKLVAMLKPGGYLLTIEDEHSNTKRHFARNYNEVFVPLGLREIRSCQLRMKELESFFYRVFRKET
ncbi:MAG: class I SAM-dependent methyltransferase [Acidobacteria bacterium]|nr:class I SAM-dependent methyltransferase [Acidobacteriota bacterium]